MREKFLTVLVSLVLSLAVASSALAAKASIEWKIGSFHSSKGLDIPNYNLDFKWGFCTIYQGLDGDIEILAQDYSSSTEDQSVEINDEITLINNDKSLEMKREIYTLTKTDDNPDELHSGGKPVFDLFLPYVKNSKVLPENIKSEIKKWFRIK